MDKKKAFLVILLAIVLAIVAVLVVFKTEKDVEYFDITQKEDLLLEDEINAVPESIKNESVVEAPVLKQEREVQVAPTVAPIIKPLKIVEEKTEEHKTDKESVDTGITKDAASNEIVITREFKSQSPAKYSFVGFGEQKAPTK